jgi:hypothetical protein
MNAPTMLDELFVLALFLIAFMGGLLISVALFSISNWFRDLVVRSGSTRRAARAPRAESRRKA